MPRRKYRPRVEDCRILNVGYLIERVQAGDGLRGDVFWDDGVKIDFERSRTDDPWHPGLYLRYSVSRRGVAGSEPIELFVPIREQPQPFGGVRWYGRCTRPYPCGRPARFLYLPPGASRFACRTCQGLNYRTAATVREQLGLLNRADRDEDDARPPGSLLMAPYPLGSNRAKAEGVWFR